MKTYWLLASLLIVLLLTACGIGKTTPTGSVLPSGAEGTSLPPADALLAATATSMGRLVPPVISNPDFDGAALLQERCTACHDLKRVTTAKHTPEEWTNTLNRMMQKGAQLNVQEQQLLIEYLAQNYHP